MGIFDDFGMTFKGLVGQTEPSALPQLLGPVLKQSSIRDLQGVVDRLEQNGLGDRVWEWANHQSGTGLSPSEVEAALGSKAVDQLAGTLGLSTDSALSLLASSLPTAVDAASKSGAVVIHRHLSAV
jgi:uncharacterized protein YidB (DUF937 family)